MAEGPRHLLPPLQHLFDRRLRRRRAAVRRRRRQKAILLDREVFGADVRQGQVRGHIRPHRGGGHALQDLRRVRHRQRRGRPARRRVRRGHASQGHERIRFGHRPALLGHRHQRKYRRTADRPPQVGTDARHLAHTLCDHREVGARRPSSHLCERARKHLARRRREELPFRRQAHVEADLARPRFFGAERGRADAVPPTSRHRAGGGQDQGRRKSSALQDDRPRQQDARPADLVHRRDRQPLHQDHPRRQAHRRGQTRVL